MGQTLTTDITTVSSFGQIQFFQSASNYQPTSSAPATAASFHIIVSDKVGGSIVSDSAMNPYIKFSLISSSYISNAYDEELIIRFFTSSHFKDKLTSSFTGDGDLWNVSSPYVRYYYTSSNPSADYRDIQVFATASDHLDTNYDYATVLRNKIHDAITGSKFGKSGVISQSKSGNNTSSIFYTKIKGAVTPPTVYTGSLGAYGASVTSSFIVQTITTGSGTLNYSEPYFLSEDSASYIMGIDPNDKISFRITTGTSSLAHTGSRVPASESIILYVSGGAGGKGKIGFGTDNPKTKFDFKGDGFKIRSDDGTREISFEEDGRFTAKKYADAATSESVGSQIQLSYTPGTFDEPKKAQVGETIGTINFVDESFNEESADDMKVLKSGSVAQITSTVRRVSSLGAAGDLQFLVNVDPTSPHDELVSFLTIDPQTYGSTVLFPYGITATTHITASGNISGSSTSTLTIGGRATFGSDTVIINGTSGHITASGNISASGIITANAFTGTLTGTATGLAGTPDIVVGSLTATSITSSIVTSSIIYTEGSNIFGDTSDDTHKFNGSITASGNISSSGQIIGLTGSFAQTVITLKSGAEDSPFIITIADSNGQDNKLEVNKDGVLKMGALDDLPTAVTGGLVYSASAFYMGL